MEVMPTDGTELVTTGEREGRCGNGVIVISERHEKREENGTKLE